MSNYDPELKAFIKDLLRDYLNMPVTSEEAFTRIRASLYSEEELINQSSTSSLAFNACVYLIEKLLVEKKELPSALLKFNIDVLKGEKNRPKKKGRKKYQHYLRDSYIIIAIENVMSVDQSLKPYAHFSEAGKEKLSASGLVSECLIELGQPLGYEAVKKIWIKYKKAK